jgi:hypothetical protein
MTTLAIDTFGHCAGDDELSLTGVGQQKRIGVVAEEAFLVDLTAEVQVIGAIISRVHGPKAAPFGVPADRQLQQMPIRRFM